MALDLPEGGHFVVGPEPRLHLVRRMPLWSTGRRWFFGIALSLFTLLVAFPKVDPHPGHVLLFLLGSVVWALPLSRFFVSHERRTGFHLVRRELWIRAEAERATIEIDGVRRGDAHEAQVRVIKALEWTTRAPRQQVEVPAYTLALVVDKHAYELLNEPATTFVEPLAAGLARAIDRPVMTKEVGHVDAYSETVPSFLSFWVPAVAAGIGQGFWHVAPGDSLYLAIGVAALLARASVGVWRVTQAVSAQGKNFATHLRGAVPALPPLWLSPSAGLAICVAAHALLALSVAGLAWRV